MQDKHLPPQLNWMPPRCNASAGHTFLCSPFGERVEASERSKIEQVDKLVRLNIPQPKAVLCLSPCCFVAAFVAQMLPSSVLQAFSMTPAASGSYGCYTSGCAALIRTRGQCGRGAQNLSATPPR